MYRLGCFRDDIVFFIFLYQRWIYKVDHKRVNEFGFSGEMEQQKKESENGNLAIAEVPSYTLEKTMPNPEVSEKNCE
ncbi:unnamed protein product, partial [Iphiclides podalirius]